MSLKTLKMRRNIPGESTDAHINRQHIIDNYQRHEENILRTWSYQHGWGDSYNIDADEKSEEYELRNIENEVWKRKKGR
jgi:hypothetical protein